MHSIFKFNLRNSALTINKKTDPSNALTSCATAERNWICNWRRRAHKILLLFSSLVIITRKLNIELVHTVRAVISFFSGIQKFTAKFRFRIDIFLNILSPRFDGTYLWYYDFILKVYHFHLNKYRKLNLTVYENK